LLFLKNEEDEVPSFCRAEEDENEEDAITPNAGAPSFPPLEQLLLLEHRPRCCFFALLPPPRGVFEEEEEEATFCAKALPPRANDDDDDAEAAIIGFSFRAAENLLFHCLSQKKNSPSLFVSICPRGGAEI